MTVAPDHTAESLLQEGNLPLEGNLPPLSYSAWPAPASVRGVFSTRRGGFSTGAWGDANGRNGLNLGGSCKDDASRVARNRARLADRLGVSVRWLQQVHGTRVIDRDSQDDDHRGADADAEETADGHVTTARGIALAVLVADCLPVLLADRAGGIVGAAHAGWRGLGAGILENTVAAMRARRPGAELIAALGPCIGPSAFEVGQDVLDAFIAHDVRAQAMFRHGTRAGKWWADLAGLATQRLQRLGVTSITNAGVCTVASRDDFWSYRRDRVCGRMAGIVWLQQ